MVRHPCTDGPTKLDRNLALLEPTTNGPSKHYGQSDPHGQSVLNPRTVRQTSYKNKNRFPQIKESTRKNTMNKRRTLDGTDSLSGARGQSVLARKTETEATREVNYKFPSPDLPIHPTD